MSQTEGASGASNLSRLETSRPLTLAFGRTALMSGPAPPSGFRHAASSLPATTRGRSLVRLGRRGSRQHAPQHGCTMHRGGTTSAHARWSCDASSMSSSATCEEMGSAPTRCTAGGRLWASLVANLWATRSPSRRRIQRPMPRSPLHATRCWMTPYARASTTVSEADGHAAGAVAREMVVMPGLLVH